MCLNMGQHLSFFPPINHSLNIIDPLLDLNKTLITTVPLSEKNAGLMEVCDYK